MSRYNRMMPISAVLPGLPSFEPPRTRAAWPVWSGSVRDVNFARLTKKQAVKLYHQARAWNREKVAGRYGGRLGSTALRVLECLIFDFLHYATGRLDPSYDAIAQRTGLGRSTIAVALARLKELGVVHWLRRCTEAKDAAGRFILRQHTNAYAVLSPSQWRGYRPPPTEVPPLHATQWGAVPPLPPLLDQALEAGRGGNIRAMMATLEQDPDDPLAAALARLGRSLRAREPDRFHGSPDSGMKPPQSSFPRSTLGTSRAR